MQRARFINGDIWRRALFSTIIVLLVAAIAGCQTRQIDRLSARIINKSIEKLRAASSYHFKVNIQVSSSKGSRNIAIEGDWKRFNRMDLELRAEGVERRLVVIGRTVYSRRGDKAEWTERRAGPTENSPLESIDILKEFDSAKRLSDSSIDSRDTYHIVADYDAEVFAGKSIGFNSFPQKTVDAATAVSHFWIDKKTKYPGRITLVFRNLSVENRSYNLGLRIGLNRYNQLINIEAPK